MVKASPHPSLHMMLWSRTHKYLSLECCFNTQFLRSFSFIFGNAQFPHCRSLSGLQQDAEMLGMGCSPPPVIEQREWLHAVCSFYQTQWSVGIAAAAGAEGAQDCTGRQMWSGWMGWVGALGFFPRTAPFMSVQQSAFLWVPLTPTSMG